VRAFVAIEAPESVRGPLTGLMNRLREAEVRVSWTRPENLHLTLRFLGDVPPETLDRIGEMLAVRYRDEAPFPLEVRGAGAFPNTRRPGILWAGVEPLEGPLAQVQEAAETEAQEAGLPGEGRPFHPHVTLGRVRGERQARRLQPLLEREARFDGGGFLASSAALITSQLTPGGPIYRCVRPLPFGAPQPSATPRPDDR
jgi:2'-5' RNA ligase